MNTKVICIGGQARHGKDYTAMKIKEELEQGGYRVLVTHYADLLKHICKSFFNWNGEKDERGRHILQYVGTEGVRNQLPNFWVDFIIQMLELFNKNNENWDYILIPDTRFPNEIDRLIEAGYETMYLKVIRYDFDNGLNEEAQSHISEHALDEYEPDVIISNTGDDSYSGIVRDFVDCIKDDDFWNLHSSANYMSTQNEISDIELINKFSHKQYTKDEVYVFTVKLLTNDIDSDYERFTKEALIQIGEQSIGGIIICSIINKTMQGKIIETWLEKNEGQFTSDNYQLYTLKAKAFIPICEENEKIIEYIDNNKLIEISDYCSISCWVNKMECSMCGENLIEGQCNHIAGKVYDGKICVHNLMDVNDIYEYAFTIPTN